MRSSFNNSARDTRWIDKVKRFIYETPVEIAIGAVLFGTIAGVSSYEVQKGKEGQIPLAFSEIEQTTRDFAAKGQPVPPLTLLYSLTNDATMKVFESNNIALAKDETNKTFARELETRIDPDFKTHMLISEISAEMPKDAGAALGSVSDLIAAVKELPPIMAALDASWSESHRDVTHTVYDPVRSCDSKGQNCTTTYVPREVYDYTIHDYDYNAQQGQYSARLLQDFVAAHPKLDVTEQLHYASKTHADNENAMAQSMRNLLKGKPPTPEQALGFANTWARGSNLVKYLPTIRSRTAELPGLSSSWTAALETAHSETYRTYSHSDNGPSEYRAAQAALGHTTTIQESSARITGGIRDAGYAIPALTQQIKTYIDVAEGRKPGDADKLRGEVMKTARDIYNQNFENGFDVQPFKWWAIALFTVLGAGMGAGAGAGVDKYLNDRLRRQREKKYTDPKNEENNIPGSKRWSLPRLGWPKRTPDIRIETPPTGTTAQSYPKPQQTPSGTTLPANANLEQPTPTTKKPKKDFSL
ncbi:MAG: hypothetical protein PW788_10785 [Micavibrio sp.]|nr:hypothetical protein [Micavibrio sp.]